MSRLGAAALALLVTLAIFGMAVAAAVWLFGATTFLEALNARWFPLAVVVFNSLVISLLVIVLAIRRRRADKDAEQDRSGLLSASERLKRRFQPGGH